jgi:hypothetical protein
LIKRLIIGLLLLAAPVHAVIDVNTGTFTVTSAGGTGNKTYAHGLASTPKVAIMWTTYPGDSARGTNDLTITYCVVISSSSRRTIWMGSQNGLDGSEADSRSRNDKCLMIYNGTTPTLIMDADFVSFDGTNITLNITDAPTSDTVVVFKVLGGADLTNQALVTFTQPGATGNFDTTTVGFQGNFLMLFSTNATALNTNTLHAAFNIGFSDGTNAALHSSLAEDGSASSDTRRYLRSAASQLDILARLSESNENAIQRLSFVSWLSNGFRLNAVETTASATQIFALVLQGGRYAVGDFASITSINPITETGLSFQPKGLFVTGHGSSGAAQHTVDSPTTENQITLGAAVSTTARAAHWTHDGDASTTNVLKRNKQVADKVAIRYDTSTPPVVVGDIDFNSFTSGGFILDQEDADSAQFMHIYFVVGDSPLRNNRVWIDTALRTLPLRRIGL